MQLVKWANLSTKQQNQVRAAFVMWKYDPTSKTFTEWANKHAFYITKAGNLSNRHHHCEPHYMADHEVVIAN